MIEEKERKKLLAKTPHSPGIYKMTDKEGKVIYIGKAKDLKKRLSQYFQQNYEHSTRTKKLLENISNIEIIAVDTDLEAIILESTLIKQLQPKYNVIMKDDKNYVYIKITKEDFPRIQIVRKIEKDGAKYIGPKTAVNKVETTFKILKKIFPFRHCGLDIEFIKPNEVKITNKVIKYPCLDYYIKTCLAPCTGKCGIEEYKEIIKNVEKFLSGSSDEILKNLKEKMQTHAKNKEFEKAIKLRDKIKKVEEILEKQKVSDPNQKNKDIINYYVTREKAYFNLFQIRDGKLIGQENFILSAENLEENSNDKEVLEAFLTQYYKLATDIPQEILLPHELEDQATTELLLIKYTDKKIQILVPQKGIKNKLLEMSLNNAKIFADRNKPSWQEESDLTKNATKELQKILKIKDTLKRIECYDISHISGSETVGSMIVFENGVPKNSMYRQFKLKTVQDKPDDYRSMNEVLFRRFSKIALDVEHKKYIFRKAKKRDHKFIESNYKIDLSKKDRDFYILEKNKKPVGFIAIKKHSDKVTEITSLWLLKSERGKKLGYKLLKNAINKAKAKRLYIVCKTELREYYLLDGFEEIKIIPEELKERFKYCKNKYKCITGLAYDKIKHKSDESFEKIPDLVVIDGGKGQLETANKVFNDLKLKIPHISLAKKLEEIFRPDQKKSLILEHNNEALKLLQRARDEAHRFAITYNKKLRKKKLFN